MIGNAVNEGIHKFYYLVKLNIYFLLISLLGVIFLGVGPAYLAILSLHQETPWESNKIKFRQAWHDLRCFFSLGNKVFWLYLSLGLILLFSLYTTVQMQGLFFLMLSLFDVFILAVLMLASLFSFSIVTIYRISLINCVKLSMVIFFKDIRLITSIFLFFIVLVVVALKQPALLVLCGSSSLAIFMFIMTKKILVY